MKILSLLPIIFITALSISKANNIDSLKNVINSNQIEIELISDAYAEIAFYYIESEFNPDSCKKYGDEGLKLSRNVDYKNGILKNLLALGRLEYRKENIVKSDSLLRLACQADRARNQSNLTRGNRTLGIKWLIESQFSHQDLLYIYSSVVQNSKTFSNAKGGF